MYVLNFEGQNHFQLGRNQDIDIRFTEISVSRLHSTIFFQDDKFYIKDENSKFGTLVLI